MSEKEVVESKEELRRGVIAELKRVALDTLERIRFTVGCEEWSEAAGALATLDYVIGLAKEWAQQ